MSGLELNKVGPAPPPPRPNGDSGQNSMEYWDYTVEIECLKGPQDVEAAAELGRTLLERNRDLEATIRQQQVVLDDQTQEMEYLSKQNTLLRQAAESRLRLCEQMEMAASELERKQSRIRTQLDAERQRQLTLKTNLEAAEERCEELQRLLEASRASESAARSHLRALQKQQQQQEKEQMDHPESEEESEGSEHGDTCNAEEEKLRPSSSSSSGSSPLTGNLFRPESSDEAVCRLVEDMAEVEDRLHGLETEWLEEKRKRQQLEAEVVALQEENQRLQQQAAEASSSGGGFHPAITSLSLSEELLISSGDFTSAQWRDAWDNSGPLSLIGSVLTDDGSGGSGGGKRKDYETEYTEEVSADGDVFIYQRKNIRLLCPRSGRTPERGSGGENDDTFSSSSGFSDENRWIHRSTQTETPPIPEDDYRSLFQQLFAVIKENI